MKFGDRLREQRKACGLTMEELGKKIGVTGAAISRYELGQREPSFRGIELLAEALNVSPAFLQGYELPAEVTSKYPPFPEALASSFLNGKTGDNIRRLREEKGLTQKELADRAGLSTKDIRVFEDDTSMAFPLEEDIRKFSEIFQVDPKYILGTGIKGKEEYHEQVLELEHRMGIAMSQLNLVGKMEAVKRIEEMTELIRYQAQQSTQPKPSLDGSQGIQEDK